MCHFALRLVVALLTFGVGIAASSLFNFNSSRPSHRCAAPAPTAVLVASQDVPPPPPPHSCNFKAYISGGLLNGKAISKPEPVYPPIAKAARVQGTVVVEVVVNENGDVVLATAVSGPPLLQQAAVAAARKARLSPTLLSGQPVGVSGTLTYNFALE